MRKLKKVLVGILKLRYKKYIIVLFLGALLVGFLGESSIMAHIRNARHIARLQEEYDKQEAQYRELQEKIYQLKVSPEAVVLRAREMYFMHTEDEDVFVLSDDIQARP